MATQKCEFLHLITTYGELQHALVLILTLVRQLEDCPFLFNCLTAGEEVLPQAGFIMKGYCRDTLV